MYKIIIGIRENEIILFTLYNLSQRTSEYQTRNFIDLYFNKNKLTEIRLSMYV